MINERVLWTVVLCTAIWFGYMKFLAPPVPTPEVKQQQQPVEQNTNSSTVEPNAAVNTNHPNFNTLPVVLGTDQLANGVFRLSFSSLGGNLVQTDLDQYKETIKKDAPSISLLKPEINPFNFHWQFTNSNLSKIDTQQFQKKVSKDGTTIEYTAKNDSAEFHKTYEVSPNSYFLNTKLKLKFANMGKKDLGYVLLPLGAKGLEHDSNDPLKSWEIVVYQNESVTRKNLEKMPTTPETLQGNTAWLAFGNRYFSSVAINESKINPDVVLSSEKNFSGAFLRFPIRTNDQGEFELNLKWYMGPKAVDELSKVPGLRQLIDYGMFSFLAYPMLSILHFFYRFIHNYGVAIILLTIFVRILFYPLSVKSYRSMKEMQKIQPEIKMLKEKYKDDKERFNREQLALFKTHKVNPAGGCLPMLIQLPFFLALYALLANSIDLFHSPFFFWIKDLTSKDPFYVLPILMGIAMFFQQKMTPAAGLDPAQQKMMLIMPVVFTFIMLNLPSGLTLYIFVSTLLGIAQQIHMTRDKTAKTLVVV